MKLFIQNKSIILHCLKQTAKNSIDIEVLMSLFVHQVSRCTYDSTGRDRDTVIGYVHKLKYIVVKNIELSVYHFEGFTCIVMITYNFMHVSIKR